MRCVLSFLAVVGILAGSLVQAKAEPLLSVVFTGNSWGYLKPCPT